MAIDLVLKIAQILFYLVGMIIAVLTYRAAKRGLLNTVNTEYQKRVMDRLAEISMILFSEFDPTSEDHWSKKDPVGKVVEQIHKRFNENRKEILESGEWHWGIPVSDDWKRIHTLIIRLKSDPFLPKQIRDGVIDFLKAREEALGNAYFSILMKYAQDLAKGKYLEDLKNNQHWLHNKILDEYGKKGFSINLVENKINEFRDNMRIYLESFNPLPPSQSKKTILNLINSRYRKQNRKEAATNAVLENT